MNREIISGRQGVAILSFYIAGDAVILFMGREAEEDLWIATILAIIMAFLIYLVYARILSLFHGKDIFDICELIFGKIGGKVITLLFTWFCLHLGGLVLRTFGEFIHIVGLPDTPTIVPLLILMGICAWGVYEGIEVIGRWSEIFLKIHIPLTFLIESMLIPKAKLDNILPVLYNGIIPVIKGAVSALAFPFAESVVMLAVFSSLKDKKSIYKAFTYGLLLGGTILLFITTMDVMVLGVSEAHRNYFTSYIAASRIQIGDFVQRIEGFTALLFLIKGFVRVSICILAASKGISKLFGIKDYRFIILPTSLLILNLSYFSFKNIIQMHYWPSYVWPYYAIPFEVILPLIILVFCEIKIRKRNKQ